MRTFSVIAIIAALMCPAPAYAQGFGNQKNSAKPGEKSDQEKAEEQKRRKAEDKAYRDSLQRIPDRDNKKADPWSNVR